MGSRCHNLLSCHSLRCSKNEYICWRRHKKLDLTIMAPAKKPETNMIPKKHTRAAETKWREHSAKIRKMKRVDLVSMNGFLSSSGQVF